MKPLEIHPIFKLRTKATEGILRLLNSVTLGTDGAMYRHLDTPERIQDADDPLFLSMERHEKVLGNITFCRRQDDWYIRYFAFDAMLQGKGAKKTNAKDGLLRRELNQFFDQVLNNPTGEFGGERFYAYIDPRNVKSLWMSENFGFETVGQIATQSFSRSGKRRVGRVKKTDRIPPEVIKHFKGYRFYFDAQLNKEPYYEIRNDDGELLGFAKSTVAHWEIKRLPGKRGGLMVKLIPWIPIVRKVIRPKNHAFVVPEAVWVKDNDPQLLNELFEGMLAYEDKRLILWWVDQEESMYQSVRDKMKWGVLHKLIGINLANVVVKGDKPDSTQPIYTSGFDFI